MNEQVMTNRPSFPAQIDWSHPLSRSLVSCYLFNETGGMWVWDSGYKQAHGKASGTKPTSFGRLFASGDYVEVTASHLNFVAENFSIFVWGFATSIINNPVLVCRGLLNTDGWFLQILSDGTLKFFTSQVAANQSSFSSTGAATVNSWMMMGVTRAGTAAKVWINAINVTTTSGNHTNPLTSTRTLKLGAYDDLSAALLGKLALILVYRKDLIQSEIQSLYLNPYDMFLK